MKTVVTAADTARAERLAKILNGKTVEIKALATLLAEVREEAILCAVVRVEREFNVRERKREAVKVPPTGEAT